MKRLSDFISAIKANTKLLFVLETLFFLSIMLILFYVLFETNLVGFQEPVYNQF